LAICVPGAVSNIIDQYKIGTIAQAGDVEGIVDAMARLETSDTSLANWDKALTQFDGQVLTQRLASVFDAVITQKTERVSS